MGLKKKDREAQAIIQVCRDRKVSQEILLGEENHGEGNWWKVKTFQIPVTGQDALRSLELGWLELLGVENEQTIYTRKYN